MKKTIIRGMIAGALLSGISLRAWADNTVSKEESGAVETAVSPTPTPGPTAMPPVKINGFLQSWLDAGNASGSSVGKNFNLVGDLLRHFRLLFQAEPATGVKIVLVPELAGGFTLLDGYAALDFKQLFLGETTPGEITLTAGQFKTPFGLNRMYTPPQLVSVDYSIISNAVFGSKIFWDDGIMGTYKGKLFRLDVAAVKGLGPNLVFTPPFNLASPNQDYCGRLEIPLLEGRLSLGGSYYYGTHFTGFGGVSEFATPKNWFGAHAKWKSSPKALDVEVEWITRENELFGINGQVAFWVLGNFQPFVLYEYVENHLNGALSASRMGGGFNWYPRTGGPIRLTLEMVGEGLGSASGDPGSLSSGKVILQTQAVF